MRLTLTLLLSLFFCPPAFAGYRQVWNNHSAFPDYVGVSASADVVVSCDANQVLVSSGSGVWACGTSSGSTSPAGNNTEIQFNNAGSFGASNRFKWDGVKAFVSGDGTGVLGAIYVPRGDVVNQYIVLQESTLNPGSVFHTFKGSGGNAVAMGGVFSGGAPLGYTFTDPSGIEVFGINTASGVVSASTDITVAGSSVCRANGTNCPSSSGTPTGTGFPHITAGVQDVAARSININSSDITGTLPVGNGGTGRTVATDDTVLVGDGVGFQGVSVPNCTDTGGNHLNYTTATNAISCGTSSSGGAGSGVSSDIVFMSSQGAGAAATRFTPIFGFTSSATETDADNYIMPQTCSMDRFVAQIDNEPGGAGRSWDVAVRFAPSGDTVRTALLSCNIANGFHRCENVTALQGLPQGASVDVVWTRNSTATSPGNMSASWRCRL